MELNQWGDPINSVYVVLLDGAFWGVFKDWKVASEHAEAQRVKYLRDGYEVGFTVCAEPLV